MAKVHAYMFLQIAQNKSTAENKTGLFPSSFLISTSWFLILAQAFRNHHVAASSTPPGSATEMNEVRGYVTVPWSSKMTQHSSATDWRKS